MPKRLTVLAGMIFLHAGVAAAMPSAGHGSGRVSLPQEVPVQMMQFPKLQSFHLSNVPELRIQAPPSMEEHRVHGDEAEKRQERPSLPRKG